MRALLPPDGHRHRHRHRHHHHNSPLHDDDELGLLFLHVPKAGGTSFVRALLAYGCDYNATTGGVGALLESWRAGGGAWRRQCDADAFTRLHAGHAPLRADDRGRAVGVFRAPAARLASGFVHNFHDCTAPMERAFGLNCTVGGDDYACAARLPRAALPAAVRAYARCVGGCQLRLLAGDACGAGDVGTSSRLPPDPRRRAARLATAARRLARFAFAGRTEEWGRSVCAFAATFAPRRRPYDYAALFANVRPSPRSPLRDAVEAIVAADEELRDPEDEAVARDAARALDAAEARVRGSERHRECTAAWRAMEARGLASE